MTLYLDLDGVLADFDAHHEAVLGRRPDKIKDDVDWDEVRRVRNFYESIPPMADMEELWRAVEHLRPVVLTGVPLPEKVPEAADNKRSWVRKHLGPHVRVICCLAREKCAYAQDFPGQPNVLVDDWEKHKGKWVAAGGVWITHTSARTTIRQLKREKIL